MRKMIQLSTSIFWPHEIRISRVNWIQNSKIEPRPRAKNSKIHVSKDLILSVLKNFSHVKNDPEPFQLLECNVPQKQNRKLKIRPIAKSSNRETK